MKVMKNALKMAGVILLLLFVYSAFQGLFAGLVAGIFVGYEAARGNVSITQFQDVAGIEKLTDIPGLENHMAWVMAIALFLSAICMLLFIHAAKFFRLRVSIFRSIEPKPLLVSTLLVFTSMFALNLFVQFFPIEDALADEFQGLTHNILGALTISILGPVLEEVMFRGAIQGYMMRRVRTPWVAIVVAALVFGVFHLNPVQIVYATLLGVVFGWIYYRTGSLLSVIVGHVLNNSIATLTMLCFEESTESEIIEEISPFADNVLTISLFVIFSLLSVMLALRLNRILPPVPTPWHESDEQAAPAEAGSDCAESRIG